MARRASDFEQFGGQAPVAGGYAAIPQSDGAAARAAAEMFSGMAATLGRLADKAALREGLKAGQAYAEGQIGLPKVSFKEGEASPPAAGGSVAPPAAAGVKGNEAAGAKPMGMSFNGPPAAAPVAAKPGGRVGQAMAYFQKLGYAEHQAAGIVGNLMQESAFADDVISGRRLGDKGTSFGIAQWRKERLANLRSFARARGTGPGDFETQLAFIHHELQGVHAAAGRQLLAARNVDEATAAFIGFERPRGWTAANPRGGHGYANRLRFAQKALGQTGAIPVPVIGGGLADGGPLTPVAAPVSMEVFIPEPKPLALRNDGTIYGEAFDRAANETASWRLNAGLDTELNKAYEDHKDDPVAWAKARDEISARYIDEAATAGPELRQAFEQRAYQRSATLDADVFARRERQVDSDRKDAAGAAMIAAQDGIERQAYLIGTAADGDERLSVLSGQAISAIDAAEASGAISRGEAAKNRERVTTSLVTARIQGVFDALPDAAAKERFAASLPEAYADPASPLSRLDPGTFKRIHEGLLTDARQAREAGDARSVMEKAGVERALADDIASIGASGQGVDWGGKPLTFDEVAAVLGEKRAAQWTEARETARAAWSATAGMEKLAEPALVKRLESLKPKPGEADFARKQDIYELARKKAEEVKKAIDEDMLGHAARVGLTGIEPLDFSTPDTLATSLAARHDGVHAVAAYYGRPARYFARGEADAIREQIGKNPDMLPGFAVAVAKAYEGDALPALAEVAKDNRVIAHGAGLAIMTGDFGVISEMAQAMKLAGAENYEPVKMPKAARAAALREGGAPLIFTPNAAGTAEQIADMLFDQRARVAGLDPAADPEAASALWLEQYDRALGGHMVNGEKRGGLGTVNGAITALPADMSEAAVQGLLDGLTDAHLGYLMPIAAPNGVPVTADMVRQGHLVPIGPGRYRVALGDVRGPDPRYLAARNGGFWELNLVALRELAGRMPGRRGPDPADPYAILRGDGAP